MKKELEYVKLGEVAEIINGGTPKTNVKEYWDGKILWITPADLGKLSQPIVEDTPRKISEIGLQKSSAKLFPSYSVILSTRAPIGHLAINSVPMSTNQGCRGIVPSKNLEVWYLYYFLKFNVDLLNSLGTGATFKELSSKALSSIEIPLPPLPEQRSIVAILDEAFAGIERSRNAAIKNLKNARELFESYLFRVFENGNWEDKSIQMITRVINGYAFASKDFKPTNSVKSIKITNVGVKQFVEEADNYLPEKFKETLKEVQVKKGDIAIALTRTIISSGLKVAVVPASYDGALVNQRVAALVPNEAIVQRNFLYYYLTTSGVTKFVLDHVNTLMQPNLSINDLKNMPVPCPNLQVQQTIVRQLDALRAETQKLEAVYQKKLEDLEELKKSILQKAFSGELAEKAIAV